MPALQRLLPSAATDRFLPLGEIERAQAGEPPGDVASDEIQGSVKHGALWAYTLATIVCSQLPSFVNTARELSLKGFGLLWRLRGIVPAAGVMCIAVVLLRQNLRAERCRRASADGSWPSADAPAHELSG